MDLAKMRNLGIVAHIDAGKTTVSERILFYSGVEHRIGQVDDGTAVMDWMSEERERGITITAAATTVPWRGYSVNLIDTPGHVDFTVEVERCMRVLDGCVLVLDGVMGVQAQTETVWRQMRRHSVPYIIFVNKCDRAGADVLAVVADMRKRLDAPAIPLQFPLGSGADFVGLVDLLTKKTWLYEGEGNLEELEARDLPWPEDVADEIGVLRAELIDALAEEDEDCLQAVVEDREPPLETMQAALRKRVIAGSLVPVLCGAALRDIGVHPLLNAVCDYLPSPLDMPVIEGRAVDRKGQEGEIVERRAEPQEPFSALAFKLHADAHGDLTFVRIYSGVIEPGMQLFNPRAGRMERASRVLRMHAEAGKAIERAGPGEIVALTGLKWTGTGDTLCQVDSPIVLESLTFPEPVITRVVEPSTAANRDKLRAALQRLGHEDPSLVIREDEETGQWHLSGMGELHLEVIQHRLEDEFKLAPRVGQPRVAYREAVEGKGRGDGRVDRVLGGKEVFGAVSLELLPDPEGIAARVEWAPDCPVPAGLRAAVAESLLLDAQVGPRFGYPLANGLIRVVGGESRPRVDAELGFTRAASIALRQAMQTARVILLEPVMSFEIQTPAEFSSGIIADLNSRRAAVTDVRAEGDMRSVLGTVPLSQMFGYSTSVRSLSQGRAGFSMVPAGHRAVPESELAARGLVWT